MEEPKLKTSFAMPPALWRKVRMRAFEEGRTAAALLEEALERYLATTPKRAKQRKGGR